MLGWGEEETKRLTPTAVSSGDENTVGGKGVEGRARDSGPSCLRQERGGARLEHTEMVCLGLNRPRDWTSSSYLDGFRRIFGLLAICWTYV